jgi:hypothetical protein
MKIPGEGGGDRSIEGTRVGGLTSIKATLARLGRALPSGEEGVHWQGEIINLAMARCRREPGPRGEQLASMSQRSPGSDRRSMGSSSGNK